MSILFITSTHIGDAVLSTGLLSHLLDSYPDDGVTIACGAPAAKVFPAVPRLERLHIIRKQPHHRHWIDLWRSTVTRRWRVVVDLRRTALPWTIPARHRYGLPKSDLPIHRVELISRTMGLPPQSPVIWTQDSHRTNAAGIVGDAETVIALAPGASWPGKIWPADRFSTLARNLTSDNGLIPGARIALIGGPDERDAAAPLFATLPADRLIDGFGLDVLTTYELLRGCRLMVGNDSAMMHLAAASGIPTVGLFGPTKDEHYAPWGPNGLTIRTPESVAELTQWDGYDTKTTGTMMDGLTVDMVEDGIRKRFGAVLQ